jgi:3',5'-cyclic AMP phosphodiesterase CpdA
VSDLHFGGEDASALAAVADFVAARAPDVVVATGDLALIGARAELEAAFAWLRALKAPVIATPGNHDVPYYSLAGRLLDPFRNYRESAQGVATQTWRNERYAIIAENTARGVQARLNWAQGAISRSQVARVRSFAKSEIDAGKLVVLATHHPLAWPNDAPITGRTWGGRAAEMALAHSGVDVFLSGHLHVASARSVTETGAVSVCGGTLSQRVRHEPCAFTAIEVSGGALRIDIMHVVGGFVEIAATRRFPAPRREAASLSAA